MISYATYATFFLYSHYIYIYLTKGYSRYCLRYCRCYTSECCFLCMGFWWTTISTSATWQGAGWSHSGFFPRPWDVSFSKKADLLKKKNKWVFLWGSWGLPNTKPLRSDRDLIAGARSATTYPMGTGYHRVGEKPRSRRHLMVFFLLRVENSDRTWWSFCFISL